MNVHIIGLGGEDMGSNADSRRKLDTSKIVFSPKTVSSKEGLSDVTPIAWVDSVRSGSTKVTVSVMKPQGR